MNLINVGPLNKDVGHGKKSNINKRRTYVYSGVVLPYMFASYVLTTEALQKPC